jgi:hypothetical protein
MAGLKYGQDLFFNSKFHAGPAAMIRTLIPGGSRPLQANQMLVQLN